jgi:hypothetical protein
MRITFKIIIAAILFIFPVTTVCYGNPFPLTFCHSDTLSTIRSVTITAVGDVMLGTSYPSPRYLPPGNNPRLLLGDLIDSLKASDITFGNLEGSLSNDGKAFKKCRDTSICYLFRMPEKYIGTLADAGFNILSLANNHFGDFGWSATKRTRELLDSAGIKYAGPVENPYAIFNKDSVTYGFCAFSPVAGSTDMMDLEKSRSIISFLAKNCDVVIVSFHGGAEGADFQRVSRKDEIFYGEERGNVYEFAHKMIDAGADVVLGHGPHVTRAIEIYKNRFIIYSLGNFCTYGRFNLSGPTGFGPIIRIKIEKSGKFLSGRIIPVYQGEDGVVRIDDQGRAIRKIKELTKMDFPEDSINISDDGRIFYK